MEVSDILLALAFFVCVCVFILHFPQGIGNLADVPTGYLKPT